MLFDNPENANDDLNQINHKLYKKNWRCKRLCFVPCPPGFKWNYRTEISVERRTVFQKSNFSRDRGCYYYYFFYIYFVENADNAKLLWNGNLGVIKKKKFYRRLKTVESRHMTITTYTVYRSEFAESVNRAIRPADQQKKPTNNVRSVTIIIPIITWSGHRSFRSRKTE